MLRECTYSRTLPQVGMHWKIHPPQPSRFPSVGDFAPLSPWAMSWASGCNPISRSQYTPCEIDQIRYDMPQTIPLYWDPVTGIHDAQHASNAVNEVCLAAENRGAVNFNLRETDCFCLRRNLKAPTRCQVCRYCTSSACGLMAKSRQLISNILKQNSRSLPRPNF